MAIRFYDHIPREARHRQSDLHRRGVDDPNPQGEQSD